MSSGAVGLAGGVVLIMSDGKKADITATTGYEVDASPTAIDSPRKEQLKRSIHEVSEVWYTYG